jgi:hypothetical protein
MSVKILNYHTMKSGTEEIKRLKKLVRKLTDENEYLRSPLYLFEVTEAIQGSYSGLLNPPLKELLTTTLKQKACTFQLDINDIICIKSDGKIKWIFLTKKQKSISGELFESDKLQFTGSIADFCKKYDTPKIHLCTVSRSVAVNPNYYFLSSKKLLLVGNVNPHGIDIPISSRFVDNFIERKATLERISSFQKIDFHSK